MHSDPIFFAFLAKVNLYLKAWQVFNICSWQHSARTSLKIYVALTSFINSGFCFIPAPDVSQVKIIVVMSGRIDQK